MNTVKSVYYGWGTLIVAGGGAYYFAKRSINAERAAKAETDRQKRIAVFQLEQQHLDHPQNSHPKHQSTTSQLLAAAPTQHTKAGAGSGIAGSPGYGGGSEESGNPSTEAGRDPAPTRHEGQGGDGREKSKYEANDVYRSRKGDRFS